ncbi:hypothetical protein NDU88_006206 [Pleurodeles waltl]|uniref:Uncharacterized protein n=1 Tax=Pleurodeles waltl TaxID=8319 RepID=A0AAV7RL88_PLEWA|nr:hypothetical protein NDU88_006206 [Pleurodeles waltl]
MGRLVCHAHPGYRTPASLRLSFTDHLRYAAAQGGKKGSTGSDPTGIVRCRRAPCLASRTEQAEQSDQ